MSIEKLRNKFTDLIGRGLYTEAERGLKAWSRSMRTFEPEFHQVRLALLQGCYRNARSLAQSLVSGPICPAELATEFASCLRSFALHDALAEWASHYALREQLRATDLAEIAVELAGTRSYALALVWAERATKRRPDLPVCVINHALILSYMGRFDEAASALEALIQRESTPMAFWLLTRLQHQSAQHNHLAAIRGAQDDAALSSRDRAYLGHALYKTLDDLGQFEPAWAALTQAKAAARVDSPYATAVEELRFDALVKTFPLAAPDEAGERAPEHIPIFIVGLHRSGTSLLERILGASEQVLDLGETDRLSAALCAGADLFADSVPDLTLIQRARTLDYDEVRRTYFDAARKQIGAHRFATEKTPANFLNVGFIRRAFPEARIIHMRREPTDLCFANFRELFGARIKHTNSTADLLHYHQGYQRLMGHWRTCYPDGMLEIDYETLVADPMATSRAVFDFCGLNWTEAVVEAASTSDRPVATLSAVQVRQPVHTRSVARWRRYATQWQEVAQFFDAESVAADCVESSAVG